MLSMYNILQWTTWSLLWWHNCVQQWGLINVTLREQRQNKYNKTLPSGTNSQIPQTQTDAKQNFKYNCLLFVHVCCESLMFRQKQKRYRGVFVASQRVSTWRRRGHVENVVAGWRNKWRTMVLVQLKSHRQCMCVMRSVRCGPCL